MEPESETIVIQKRKHKYYVCECGTHCKVNSTIKTDWYGTLEYMRCSTCKETMVAQNGTFLGIAAKR
jgi:predicted SprT family Zn-dependent metalloprotease